MDNIQYPKVSVIVPNYNHAAYLEQRMESIIHQTYQHFEIIILDDASIDDSKIYIEKYRTHPKVTAVLYNDKNSGTTFRQWEKGIRAAKSDLIWIAESDDWCELSFLETVVKGFIEDKDCVLAYCQSYAVTNDGGILWQTFHNKLQEHLNGKDFVYEYLGRGNKIVNASMAVFRRSAFFEVSNEYLNYRFGGDWLFWTEIARQGNVYISGRLLNYFRNHPGDVSDRSYSTGLNYIEDLRVWESMLKNNSIDKKLHKEVLSDKYAHFSEVKDAFTEEMNQEIEKAFALSGYEGIGSPS